MARCLAGDRGRRFDAPMRLRTLVVGAGLSCLAGCGEPASAVARAPSPAPSLPARDPAASLAPDELRRRLQQLGLGRVVDRLLSMVEPSVRLVPREGPLPAGPTSRFGGAPDLPAAEPWPEWEGRALAFVAQIRLEELPAGLAIGLPKAGLLSFFHVQDQSTWGFRPSDRGSSRVLFHADASTCVRREFPDGVGKDCRFRERAITAVLRPSLPSPDHEACEELALTDEEREALFDFGYALSVPAHQIGGHPQPVQNDTMQAECAMVAEGIDSGDGKAWTSPKLPLWERQGRRWRLLLQLDSDDVPGWMWGDAGMLYFWIRDEDLARGDFTNVWTIMQCS
jgi:uncharacterized protein YwqG